MAIPENYYPSQFGGMAPDDSQLGSYQYISLNDMLNNFMFEKTGEDTLLGKVNRNRVAYSMQRTIQMLNYDTLKVTRTLNMDMNPATRTVPVPHDFVNLIGVYYVDPNGERHPVLPNIEIGAGQEYQQLDNFQFSFDQDGNLLEIDPTTSINRFLNPETEQNAFQQQSYYYGSGLNDFEHPYAGGYFKRYGLNPLRANLNGRYVLDTERGLIYFSSTFANEENPISIDYVSDGLYDDGDIKVNKLAEEAVYKMTEYKILSNKPKESAPDYVLRRVKKEADTEMRNAKIRFMKLDLKELSQHFRGQSKWIKH